VGITSTISKTDPEAGISDELRLVFHDAGSPAELESLRLSGCERMHLCHVGVEVTTGTRKVIAGWTRKFVAATGGTAVFGRRVGLGREGDKVGHVRV
jgi:hypothetical protein